MRTRMPGTALLFAGTLVVAVALILGACGKKSSTPPIVKYGTLDGRVTLAGSAGTPVAGAAVTSTSGASTTTDANGQFSLTLPADQDVRINATKASYTLNQLHVRLSANETRTVALGLMAAGHTLLVPVSSGGNVTDPSSGATITLPANFVTASGPVTVSITGLDPTTDQIAALPGGLIAVNGSGATKYLKPVSFAEYTVRDAAGNVLPYNSAASAGAQIELPIPASLAGTPGYHDGDAIECYVYDPADGKWKTPVPGTIHPSSVDGRLAIQATIFHLSWYGGAPASDEVSCVSGSVRDSLGAPVAGASVEAFPGERSTTDASGNYNIQASPNSQVRVTATRLVGGVFQTATDTVQTNGIGGPCSVSNLVMKSRQPSYDVTATMTASSVGATTTYSIDVTIQLGVDGKGTGVDGAVVKIGTGGSYVTIPGLGSGLYYVDSSTPGFESLAFTAGAPYTLQLDYTDDGIVDATGQVRMSGLPVVNAPAAASTQPRTFTANWTDPGTGQPGYVPVYFGLNSGTNEVTGPTSSFFFSTTTSHSVGSGVTDPATYFPDPFLVEGPYEFTLMTIVGPLVGGLLPSVPSTPNIAGPGTSGFLNAWSMIDAVGYNSNGLATGATRAHMALTAADRREGARTREATIARVLGERYTRAHQLTLRTKAKRTGRTTLRAQR